MSSERGGRAYPVVRAARPGDNRFCSALVEGVAEVLATHGFPEISQDNDDFYALTFALWAFVYGPASAAPVEGGELGSGAGW